MHTSKSIKSRLTAIAVLTIFLGSLAAAWFFIPEGTPALSHHPEADFGELYARINDYR